MGNVRGLRTRLCPGCKEMTPHRTLYVKAALGGRPRWFQLFWACAKCGSLNHIVLPSYRLERASSQLPTALATGVINTLVEGPLDLDELIMRLRKRQMPGVRHVFNSDVAMVLEFLKGRGVVAEEPRDRTARVLDTLRGRSTESMRFGLCPAELSQGIERRGMVSLYAQRRAASSDGMRLTPVGVFCPACQYHRIETQ
jgi:hypothetical protein